MSKIAKFPEPKIMNLDLAKDILKFKMKMNKYHIEDVKHYDFEARYDMCRENYAIERVLRELEEKEN